MEQHTYAQWLLNRVAILFVLWVILAGCDPEGRKKCQWVLEPDARYKEKVDPGFIPVCARNRETMKEDCRLQTTLDFAKQAEGKKFKYKDLKVKNYGIPRTIEKIGFCE